MADFNFTERAAATVERIDAIPYERNAGDLGRKDIVEHELRKAYDAGWQARITAEESNVAALLNVDEGEPDPLDEAAQRCYAAATGPGHGTPKRAQIREELRRAFEAGREVERKQARVPREFTPTPIYINGSHVGTLTSLIFETGFAHGRRYIATVAEGVESTPSGRRPDLTDEQRAAHEYRRSNSPLDPDIERLAQLLEQRASYDIETARRLRRLL